MLSLKNLFKNEYFAAFFISLTIAGSTLIPYLYIRSVTPNGSTLTWIGNSSPSDTYTYLAWMEQAEQGHILFKGLYSSESQPRVFFHPFFLLAGWVNHILSLSNPVWYHLLRIIFGTLLLYTIYTFIKQFIKKVPIRLLALTIVGTSSGLGFLVQNRSMDLWMTESITYLSIYQTVLNSISLSIILGIFIIILKGFPKRLWSVLVCAGLMNLLILVHTYDFLIVFSVGFIFLFLEWMQHKKDTLKLFLYATILAFPSIFWQLYVLKINPVLGLWATVQSNVPAPKFSEFVSGLGLVLLFALASILYNNHKKETSLRFLIVWVITCSCLLYTPWLARFQRKFAEGIHIPIAIMATLGITWVIEGLNIKSRWVKTTAYTLLIVYLSATNIYIIHRDIDKYKQIVYPYYIPKTKQEAIDWIKKNTAEDSLLLSEYRIGNLIPGLSGRTVYMGHYDQTINYRSKYDLISRILPAVPNHTDPLLSFIKLNTITHIVVDDYMRGWGEIKLGDRSYLRLVYQNPDVEIYQVIQ